MAGGFCLVPTLAEQFKKKLKSGEINPEKMMEMTSEARRDFFSDFLGVENAKKVNALFESKLLLKNQQEGILNWAKTVTGIKPEVTRDILHRAERLGEVLQPKELDNFLEDLASQRLGIQISAEEGGKIADLAKATAEAKKGWDGKKWKDEATRIEYGRAKKAFGDYVGELKLEAGKTDVWGKIKDPVKTLHETAGFSKSIKATLDDSALFRQGHKVLFTHPEIWAKNAVKSISDIVKTVGGKEVEDATWADILSRPNAMNGLYKKEGLALGNSEEAFPTSLPEKIPGIGRLFKASEVAYKSFLARTRADVFDKYVEIAEKSGADIKGVGRLVNSLTGRGNLGAFEPAADAFNSIFFSPRFVKSQVDFLTGHVFEKSKNFGSFARKQAARNLLKVIAGTAAILGIAKAVNPDSVEFDPRSSDFGKIKIGDTRFDVSGGAASIVTLASRLAPLTVGQEGLTKNSKGELVPLNSGKFGAMTGLDVFEQFLEGKLSPVAGVLRDQLKGQDFDGNKPTLESVGKNLFLPLPFSNAQSLMENPNAADPLLGIILDAVGIGASTRSSTPKVNTLDKNDPKVKNVISEIERLAGKGFKPSVVNFDSPSGRLEELQKKLTPEEYDKAEARYEELYVAQIEKQMAKPTYQDKSLNSKEKMFTQINNDALDKVLHEFGYKKEKPVEVADERI